MSTVITYYYNPKAGGQNRGEPWIVALRADEWERVLIKRGLGPDKAVYGRHMTEVEIKEQGEISRYMSYRYKDLPSLLEDEQRILGKDSGAYRSLESNLKKVRL